MTPLAMGIDGGGTRTRVRVEDAQGNVVFEGTGGPANVTRNPPGVWQASLADAVAGAPPVAAVTAGLAGLLERSQFRATRGYLARILPGAAVQTVPDYAIALAAMPPDGACLVIAGTGSMVASRYRGRWRKARREESDPMDPGSAFDLVRRGAACAEATEHQTTPSPFFQAVREHQKARPQSPNGEPVSSRDLAALAPILLQDARMGQAYAQSAVQEALRDLARVTVRHLAEARPRGTTVYMTGGVAEAGPDVLAWFSNALAAQIREMGHANAPSPTYQVSRLANPPSVGAVRMAWRLIHGH